MLVAERPLRERWIPVAGAAAAAAGLLLLALMFLRSPGLEACALDRFAAPVRLFPSPGALLHLTELLVIICLGASFWAPLAETIQVKALQPLVQALNSDEMVVVSSTVLWYYASFSLVKVLKHVLDDRSCSRHPNSVSGHANLIVFICLSLPLLRFARPVRPVPRRHDIRWGVAYGLLVVVCLWQLWRTYFYGFHSLRQVLYGACFGVINHATWALALVRYRADLPKVALTSSAVSSALCWLMVPLERQSFALPLFVPVFLLTWRHWAQTKRCSLYQ